MRSCKRRCDEPMFQGKSLQNNWIDRIENSLNLDELEAVRVSIFGKKGELAKAFARLKDASAEEKPKIAKELNALKQMLTKAFESKRAELEEKRLQERLEREDTFYFEDGKLLRTHTSPVQIRTMMKQKPPIRMISPGAVFRRDFDLTHTPQFHQVEGLMVDKKGRVSFANLKWILEDFLHAMFGMSMCASGQASSPSPNPQRRWT